MIKIDVSLPTGKAKRINFANPKNKNIEINDLQNMPENIGSKLCEAEGTINNYAKSKKLNLRFLCNDRFMMSEGKDSIGILATDKKSDRHKLTVFKENKTSQKPLLRQMYETIQNMVWDVSPEKFDIPPVEKMKMSTLNRLREIRKIK